MRSARRFWLFAFAVFAALGAITAWYRMHSGVQRYDDEGFLLLSLKQFLDGYKLYDEVFTFYGPFHYGWQAFLFRFTGLAVSHDVVRTFSVLPWTAVPLLAAWVVYRLCRSIPVAALTHLAIFVGLQFFMYEPGQPQEICIVLFVLLAAVLSHPSRGPATAIAAGLLVAMLTLSKVNAGACAALAVGVTLLLRTRPGIVRNILLTCVVSASVLAPAVVMRPFHGTWVRQWLFAATATIAGTLIVALRTRPLKTIPLRDCVLAASAFLAGMAAILAPFLYWGTSLKAMAYMMIVRVSGGMQFEVPAGFNWLSMFSCAAALLVAAAYSLNLGGRWLTAAIIAIRWAFGLFVLSAGLALQAESIFLYASPWIWLAGIGDLHGNKTGDSRIGICLLAAIQTLWAFPVTPHVGFVAILLMLAAAICVGDSLPELQRRIGNRFNTSNFSRIATAAVILIVLAGHLQKARAAQANYQSLVPLDLPGARAVHVTPYHYQLYHWAADGIQRNCDNFITMPGMNSLYFWTRHNSPTRSNLTNWVGGYTDDEQQQMVTDFSRVTRPCVVRCPIVVDFWLQGRPLPQRPLVRWIDGHFQPVDTFEHDCQLLTPKLP
ncbi:MAG: hypothetical protein ABI806_14090 [Candidatus Solibacter sp.]